MKKSFFTCMLAIVSGVWMTNEAGNWCMPSVRTLTEPWIEVNGTFQAEGFPCEPDEECPPCLTIVLVTSNKTYYLVTDDGQLIEQLDTIQLGTKATVSGIPFEHGSYDYIQVSHIETDQTSQLPSLCDEWNVWHESFESFGPISFDKVVKYQLTTDTLINGQQYVKLTSDKDSPYLGAMREGNNRDIYYFPPDRTQEYLIYAFNAQVGDTLSNLWIGVTYFEEAAYQGVVQSISNDNPRIFTIQVKDIYQTHEDTTTYPIYWIEGVGSLQTPYGMEPTPTSLADVGVYTLLCAYKNGEQIYVSEMGAEYGCEHDQRPEPTDTIPLFSYTGDDPGSSTVDPVDPNQVVVTLKGNVLTIKETSGDVITYSLQKESSNNAPKHMPMLYANTFQNSVSVELTEEGLYQLNLSNPLWDYRIYGTFNYPQRMDAIDQNIVPQPAAEKIIRNGQLLIRKGEKVYTVQGTAINE